MLLSPDGGKRRSLWVLGHTVLTVIAVALPAVASAAGSALVPNTKIRVGVVNWSPTAGEYRAWQAIGGEFIVSHDGNVALPIIGSMTVTAMDTESLAANISTRLQKATGLFAKPDVTIEVLEYPPFYVMGDVEKPGEYKYAASLNVLQAVAMSGGVAKPSQEDAEAQLKLAGSLKQIQGELLMHRARISRLEAEMSGQATITRPTVNPSDAKEAEVYDREQAILSARTKEIERQSKNLSALRDLLTAEIDVLGQKRDASDAAIRTTEHDLNAVSKLVDQGVVVASRRSDLQRELSDLRSERLDHVTAIMRAKQGIAEATRNIEGLKDRHQTEVVTMLQEERASLRQTEIRQEFEQKMLLDMLAKGGAPTTTGRRAATYTISRSENGNQIEIAATEATPLLPGDVVILTISDPAPEGEHTSAIPPTASADSPLTQKAQ